MNVKTLLTIAGVISLLFGLLFMLAPDTAAALFGGPVDSSDYRLTLRFLGAAVIGMGAVYLSASKTSMSY